MSHTPGPWRVSSTRPTQIIDDHGICIAECLDRGTETPSPEANARLVAAAPIMLQALERLDWYFTGLGMAREPGTMLGSIDAAIRAAKGDV